MDVPVIFNDKFLQSIEFDLVVPPFQLFSGVWDIPVVQRGRVRTVRPVQEAQKIPRYRYSSWWVSTCPSMYNDRRRGAVSAGSSGVPQLQSSGVWNGGNGEGGDELIGLRDCRLHAPS